MTPNCVTKHFIRHEKLPDAVYIEDHSKRWDSVLKKWNNIVRILKDNHIPDNIEGDSCAFCAYYHSYLNSSNNCGCFLCPICMDTNHASCTATPYADFYEAVSRSDVKQALFHALDMLCFLLNLRLEELRKTRS